MARYNTTQLTPQNEFEQHIYHRDQFAHYFRWSHALKNAKKGQRQRILDYGCGSGEMLELFYHNRFLPAKYVGLDIRSQDKNIEKWQKLDFAEFHQVDLCGDVPFELGTFDVITCFEVMEHIGHENADKFLQNMTSFCGPDTTIYLSTPNYDPKVGAAKNHIINGEVGEWLFDDLKEKLEQYFDIQHVYGTFASMKDYKASIKNDWRGEAFNALSKYYDTEMIAVIMAPMIDPKLARNCLWVLKPLDEGLDDLL